MIFKVSLEDFNILETIEKSSFSHLSLFLQCVCVCVCVRARAVCTLLSGKETEAQIQYLFLQICP